MKYRNTIRNNCNEHVSTRRLYYISVDNCSEEWAPVCRATHSTRTNICRVWYNALGLNAPNTLLLTSKPSDPCLCTERNNDLNYFYEYSSRK